jgi:single-stranded-DNA-specific exonuclease
VTTAAAPVQNRALQQVVSSPVSSLTNLGALGSGAYASAVAGGAVVPVVVVVVVDEVVGGESLEELHRLNGERQSFVEELQEEIIPELDTNDAFLVIASDRITPGTAGLVAGRLSEKFGRPSMAAAVVGDLAVGSVRSIPEVDLMECLEHSSVKKFLKTFGGHAQAAGCTFAAVDAKSLQKALNAVLTARGISVSTLL